MTKVNKIFPILDIENLDVTKPTAYKTHLPAYKKHLETNHHSTQSVHFSSTDPQKKRIKP